MQKVHDGGISIIRLNIRQTMIIQLNEINLSDGNVAWNLTFQNAEIPAVSFKDAMLMADKIRDAINQHSCETASIN